MKNSNQIVLALFFCLTIFAEMFSQSFDWARSFGAGNNEALSIATDADGNVYSTGWFSGTVDFDPEMGINSLTANGWFRDVFVQKLDRDGSLVWALSFGAVNNPEAGHSITVGLDENVYVAGAFSGSVDFDPGSGSHILTSSGNYDAFILKLDSLGNFIWAKSFGQSIHATNIYSIDTDDAGNIYSTGNFRGSVDFDPGSGNFTLTSLGNRDAFVQKLDSLGNFVWAKSFGSASWEEGLSLYVDPNGDIYTTGHFRFSVDFDPNSGVHNISSNGFSDVFVHKMSSSGNLLWVKTFGGSYLDRGNAITGDASGNIYLAGNFSDTVDFNPGAGVSSNISNGNTDVFIQKLNQSGQFVWAKTFGHTGPDDALSIQTDGIGNTYTTGFFGGTVDFDPDSGVVSITASGSSDIFVHKLNPTGLFSGVDSYGGIAGDKGNCLSLDTDGNLFVSGWFNGTVDFDPGLTIDNHVATPIAWPGDIFIQKMNLCVTDSGTDFITTCNSYSWIDGITYTSSNDSATYVLTNVNGCDSIVKLNLTINANTGVDVVSSCSPFTWIDGITYFTSNNSASHILVNSFGCDSIVSLDLTVNIVDTSVVKNGIVLSANATNASYQWLDCNTMQPIAGKTNQSFTPNQNGDYAVVVTDNGCTDTSACYAIYNIGMEEWETSKMKIYPNPSSGNFTLELNQTINGTLEIYTLSGQRVYQQRVNGEPELELNLELAKGVYILRLSSENSHTAQRLIIQ